MQWFWEHYIGNATTASDPRVSPLLGSNEAIAATPPALVITAEFDPLRDEGESYARKLAECGVAASLTRYYGNFHGFFSMVEMLDDAKSAHAQAAAILSTNLNR